MELTRNLIVLVIGGLILTLTVRSLRAGRLKERYALLFMLLGLPFLILAVWRDAMGLLAQSLGVDYRTLTILMVTTFMVIMNLKMLSLLSVQEKKINELAQRLGVLSLHDRDGENE